MYILRSIWHIRAATTCKKSEYDPNGLFSVMYTKTKAEITLNYKLQIKRSPCECILEGDLFLFLLASYFSEEYCKAILNMVLYFYKSPSFLIFEICFFRSLKRELFLILPTSPLSDLLSDGGLFIYINELVNVQVGHS